MDLVVSTRRTPAAPRLAPLAALAASALAGLLACAALLAALAGPALPAWAAPSGVTLNYPSGLAPCDTTLQACLDGAADGDTILLAAGDYFTDTLVLSHAVSLTGVSSATVILHAQPSQRLLTVSGAAVDSSVIISGFTLSGGQALGDDCPAGCGGAMLITDTAQPRLFNLTFFSNTAHLFAGGLYADAGSPLVLDGLAFISNTSAASGAGARLNDAAVIRASLFQDNACASAGCVGGGLDAEANLTLTATRFLRNTSDSAGGGVFAFGDTTVSGGQFVDNHCYGPLCSGGGLDVEFNLVMSGTRFVSNTSTTEGGGAFVFVGSVVTNSIFIGNQSLDGGGLYQCEGGGWGDYVNDLFAGNTASEDGDALYIGSPAGAAVRFSTLAGPGLGAAIYVSNGAVGITDTLVASASVGFEADTGSLLDDHNLFSGVTVPYTGAVTSTGHSLTATVVFSSPAANDYHLLRGSPAIDAGVDAGIHVDVDGQPRPLLGGFDIGYDEYPLWSLLLPLLRR